MSPSKIEGQPIFETTVSAPWDLLHEDILSTIFKNLCLGDRVRAKLVCKSWEQILTRGYIPQMSEAPWEILSEDSYNEPESCLKEIQFRSLLEQRIYRFQLPPSIRNIQQERDWWCLGSSCGWLLIAVGHNLNVDMFLWQPISGETHKLPPPSTLPFFNEYIELGMTRKLERLTSIVHRVEVFSMGSTECIVAVIFRRNSCSEIALSTPQEETWKVFGGGDAKLDYSDIIFRSSYTKLCALVTRISPQDELENFLFSKREILLTNCSISLQIVYVQIDNENIVEAEFPLGLELSHPQKHILHLVESPLSHDLLVVSTILNCLANEDAIGEPIARFRCQQTTRFLVSVAGEESLELLSGIGDQQTIFLGSYGSFSILTVEGVKADCIYFAKDEAFGVILNEDVNVYAIREHGLFSLQQKKMQRISFNNVQYPLRSKVGWFTPRL